VNWTGEPSVSAIAMRVTRSLPQDRQVAPARAPGWVREPRGTFWRATVLERGMSVSTFERPMTDGALPVLPG
jgi:hypothetical protein